MPLATRLALLLSIWFVVGHDWQPAIDVISEASVGRSACVDDVDGCQLKGVQSVSQPLAYLWPE